MKLALTVKKQVCIYGIMTWCICLGLSAETPSPKVYTLASYNIKGTSMTGSRMAEVTKVVQYINADCVALQEVNSYTKGDNETSYTFHDWLGQLMRDGGMNHSYFMNTDKGNKTYYGIGMLTKEKPVRVVTKLINNPGGNSDKSANNDYGENRGLIVAEFDDYYYIGGHFSLIANYRRVMVDWVVDTIQNFRKPVFIGGDFNMTWTTTPMPYLKNGGLNNNLTGTGYAYPSTSPNKCIDFIIGQEGAAINTLGYSFASYGGGLIYVSDTDLGLASDHLPVFCRFSLNQSDSRTVAPSIDRYRISSVDNGIHINGIESPVQVRVYDMNGLLVYHDVVSDSNGLIPVRKRNAIVLVEIQEGNLSSISKVSH